MKTWGKTSVQGILRHKSGGLYARIYKEGKEKWLSLRTPIMEIAKQRLREKVGELETKAKAKASAHLGRMTMGDCLNLFEKHAQEGWSLKGRNLRGRKKVQKSSIHYRLQTLRALKKSWPELASMDVRKVSFEDCEKWANSYFKQVSPTRFNNTLDTLRHALEEAVKCHARQDNPALKVGRCSVRAKNLTLPSRADFLEFVQSIQTAGGARSKECANLVQLLAFTGARLNEAKHIEWKDIDFKGGAITLRVTKNGELRKVPMIPDARKLLEKMRSERPDENLSASVLQVYEAQKSMDHAAKKIGMMRITHHDLRHLFATICIESGVDIQTVSRWLGHKDGGVLAMKTYGHLRDEHSKLQANKVNFSI